VLLEQIDDEPLVGLAFCKYEYGIPSMRPVHFLLNGLCGLLVGTGGASSFKLSFDAKIVTEDPGSGTEPADWHVFDRMRPTAASDSTHTSGRPKSGNFGREATLKASCWVSSPPLLS
jgi:hypothetical protein